MGISSESEYEQETLMFSGHTCHGILVRNPPSCDE